MRMVEQAGVVNERVPVPRTPMRLDAAWRAAATG